MQSVHTSKTKPDRAIVTIKDEMENGSVRFGIRHRTSTGSRNMAEMRMRKEKSAITP